LKNFTHSCRGISTIKISFKNNSVHHSWCCNTCGFSSCCWNWDVSEYVCL